MQENFLWRIYYKVTDVWYSGFNLIKKQGMTKPDMVKPNDILRSVSLNIRESLHVQVKVLSQAQILLCGIIS